MILIDTYLWESFNVLFNFTQYLQDHSEIATLWSIQPTSTIPVYSTPVPSWETTDVYSVKLWRPMLKCVEWREWCCHMTTRHKSNVVRQNIKDDNSWFGYLTTGVHLNLWCQRIIKCILYSNFKCDCICLSKTFIRQNNKNNDSTSWAN